MKRCVLSDTTISNICECEYKYFLSKANVLGLGVGYKVKGGFYTNRKCITVFVNRKLSKNEIYSHDMIPQSYKGIIMDVRQIGIPQICSLTRKIRPALGGYCIGIDGAESGSIGCLVGDSNRDYILTCNHVVAMNLKNNINKIVVQPSPQYGGKAVKDAIGNVSNFIIVRVDSDDNFEDAAIVETNRSKSSIAIAFKGTLKGTNYVQLGQIVDKVGATTELTTGVVENINVTIRVNFINRQVIFKNQIVTTKMSDKGDSGSVLLSNKKEALGLLMAQSDSVSIFNEIEHILDALNVSILRN